MSGYALKVYIKRTEESALKSLRHLGRIVEKTISSLEPI